MQNGSDMTNEIKEFIVPPAAYEIQIPVCDRTVTCEVSGDFILPDYLPEIKRLLRVTPTVQLASKYIGAGTAEFAGSVNYNVLYTDNDGKLFSAPLYSDYDFECKLGEGGEDVSAEGVMCDTEVDSISCRPVGPRKLVIKSRLSSRVCAYRDGTIPERTLGAVTAEDEFSLERLRRVYPTAYIMRAAGDEITVSEEIPLDTSAGEVHPVFCEGTLCVSDASCIDGGVSCRAEIVFRCVLEKEDGEMYTCTKRIPVSDTVTLEGAERGCDCRAWGSCGTIKASVEAPEGDRRATLVCEVSATLEAEVQKKISLTVSEDAYSTLYACECTYKDYEMPSALRALCGNVSVSHSLPLGEAGIAPGAYVIDACGTAKVENIESVRGKYVASGICSVAVLLSGDAVESSEFDIPFKYELDGDSGDVSSFDCTAKAASVRVRIEGENAAVDADIVLALSLYGKNTVRVADTVKLDKNSPHGDAKTGAAFVVCYPDKGASLWEVAKRYHTSAKNIARSGGIEDVSSLDLSSPTSLSGVEFIIFEK